MTDYLDEIQARADAAQSPDEDGVAWGYWIDNATVRTAIRDALEAR